MKKILISLLAFLIISNSVIAAGIEVLPTMQTKSSAPNKVWVGTFQLVWNDLMDKIVFGKVKFMNENLPMADELNARNFSVSDISYDCYYKYAGKVTNNTKKTIEKAIMKKFNETSDILNYFYFTPAKNRYFLYAMLKKDFKFSHSFDNLGQTNFRDVRTNYFGLRKYASPKLREQVNVLFYNSASDFAVVLNSLGKDEVILYRTSNSKPFVQIYKEIIDKQNLYNGNKNFDSEDELKVPDLKFNTEHVFEELSGKRIKGTQLEIEKAIETVKFNLNNEGVVLKSEAAIGLGESAHSSNMLTLPRYFYFNDTFILFLREKGKMNPYFALRVHDISDFQN